MALHDDQTGPRFFIAASIWCSEVRATCVAENQVAELHEMAGRTTNITEAPLFRGDTITGAKLAFANLEDRGASLPRGVVPRFGWSKKLKSSSLKCQCPLELTNALNYSIMESTHGIITCPCQLCPSVTSQSVLILEIRPRKAWAFCRRIEWFMRVKLKQDSRALHLRSSPGTVIEMSIR